MSERCSRGFRSLLLGTGFHVKGPHSERHSGQVSSLDSDAAWWFDHTLCKPEQQAEEGLGRG